MKDLDFIAKAKDIANNYKTLYIMGCFGAPMSDKNKQRYTRNHPYNRRADRTKKHRGLAPVSELFMRDRIIRRRHVTFLGA